MQPVFQIHKLVWLALLVALIAVGGLSTVPFGPIPFTLQGLFMALAGLALGSRRGVLAVALYVLIGVAGLPVFAGGASGLGVLLGPTGGYLFGYMLFVPLLGQARSRGLAAFIGLAVLAELALYAPGVLWMRHVLELPFGRALAVGMLPFLIPDALKLAAAYGAWRFLRRQGLLPA